MPVVAGHYVKESLYYGQKQQAKWDITSNALQMYSK